MNTTETTNNSECAPLSARAQRREQRRAQKALAGKKYNVGDTIPGHGEVCAVSGHQYFVAGGWISKSDL